MKCTQVLFDLRTLNKIRFKRRQDKLLYLTRKQFNIIIESIVKKVMAFIYAVVRHIIVRLNNLRNLTFFILTGKNLCISAIRR